MSDSLFSRAIAANEAAIKEQARRRAERSAEARRELVRGANETTRRVLGLELDGGYTIVSDDTLTFEYDGLSFSFLQDVDEPWNQALRFVRPCVSKGCKAPTRPVENIVQSLEQLGEALADPATHDWECAESAEPPPPTWQTRLTGQPSLAERLHDVVREVAQQVLMEGV